MKCDKCGWEGKLEDARAEVREKSIIDYGLQVFFAYARKKRFYCPKCGAWLWEEFADGPMSGI